MSTYTQILYQIVYGGKKYSSFLNEKNEEPLYAYIAGILRKKNCYPYIVGGYKNHVHLITHLHPAISLADLVKNVKTYSNKFMKDRRMQYSNFIGWQVGYGAFTYDLSHKETLINYVKGQRAHHTKHSYKKELIAFLKESESEYDERYLLI